MMNMIKRFLSITLCIILLTSTMTILPDKPASTAAVITVEAASSATQFTDRSGNLNSTPLTKQQLKDIWSALPVKSHYEIDFTGDIFDVSPSVTAPYTTGKLSDEFLQTGIDYLNFIRTSANLLPTELTDDLNDAAQHGAVVLAANDVLSHTPSRPSDMDYDFYKKGYSATSTSNITYSRGYEDAYALVNCIYDCIEDSEDFNIDSVGHRRWLLNPLLKYVGMGYAETEDDNDYIVTKVFDTSNDKIDYNFVSWPASGNFISSLVSPNTPWSISLNPSKYKKPSVSKIKVTVTEKNSGQTWVFDSNTSHTASDDAYIVVNNSSYGEGSCIVFRPDVYTFGDFEGIYTVEVSGLYLTDGTKTTIRYQTDFFDTEGCFEHNYEDVVYGQTCTNPGSLYKVCTGCDKSKFIGLNESALGHNKTTVGILKPTCTTEGHKAGTCCSRCGLVYSGMEPIEALGHDFAVSSYPDSPGGNCVVKCTRCEETDTFPTPTYLSLGWGYGDYIDCVYRLGSTVGLGDALLFQNHAYCEKGGELEISCSDDTAFEYSPRPNHIDCGSITFTKTGVYTLTVSYKYAPLVSETYTVNVIVYGDVDGDGTVRPIDYIKLKRACLGTYELTDDEQLRGDVDESGYISSFDYLCVKRIFLGTY